MIYPGKVYMNNLFSHSPKELTTDGFLAWFILEIKHDQKALGSFFYNLGLCNDPKSTIDNVSISRQEKNTDLIIRYNVDAIHHQALFENKTHTTIHSNQLSKYKKTFPDFNHYKYLKLARVNYHEQKATKKHGYDVLNAYDLHNALKVLAYDNEIVNQYIQFLKNDFIKIIDEIELSLESENIYSLFSNRQAQQYLIDSLYEKIDGLNESIRFKSRSNVGGSPWTQLDICKRELAYGKTNEYLFWRIDKRAGNYYLRLNQYANIDSDHKINKMKFLEELRTNIQPLFDKYKLNTSKPSNSGVKESEICILFFKDNTINTIKSILPALTKEIMGCYSKLKL